MRIIKNFKILWNDVSFNRSVKMLGVVMAATMTLFAANVRKDESSVKCRIFTLAMMGYHIEPIV